MTFKQAMRILIKRERLLKRVRKLLAKHDEPVPPCSRCGSPEGCYSDCPVAPWNFDD